MASIFSKNKTNKKKHTKKIQKILEQIHAINIFLKIPQNKKNVRILLSKFRID